MAAVVDSNEWNERLRQSIPERRRQWSSTWSDNTIQATRDRFISTVAALLEEDSRVAVVLAEISDARLRAIAQPYADRIFNVGIREQLMIGVAAGLAMSGMIPIAHRYAGFLVDRTYEQIKLYLTHQTDHAVLVSIGGSYDASHEGRTHQSPGDVALFYTIGGWKAGGPSHPGAVEPPP